MFGSYHGQLQASRDGGKNWDVAGPSPDGLIALASRSSSELYAATEFGLLKSANGAMSLETPGLSTVEPVSDVILTLTIFLTEFALKSGLNQGS